MSTNSDKHVQAAQDEMNYLRGQLDGLESIFLELVPFRVPLKRQDIQDFYTRRLDWAIKPNKPVSEEELRRQFNSKANQVRNLVDCAESLGNAGDKLNLLYAASSLPFERREPLNEKVRGFCGRLVNESKIDEKLLQALVSSEKLTATEARLLLASTMFLITEDVEGESGCIPLDHLLKQLINLITSKAYLNNNDPFLQEACCLSDSFDLEDAD